MRINLRGGDVAVTEHGLYRSQVGAIHQQISRE
jgi:hypothetical protein